jgi:hypothetical protein
MGESQHLKKIVDYLRKNVNKGYTMDSLKWALINQGYAKSDVIRSVEMVTREMAQEAPKLSERPSIKYEVLGEDDQPVHRKSFWKRIFGI